jgi:peptide/nickel transport system ATP-binding protein/oligopeptide transport system ATP-binding protein
MSAQSTPLLEVVGLVKHFPVRRGLFSRRTGAVRAVDGISFAIAAGETLGLVGESGCGKSTAAKTILKLIEPTAGMVRLRGERIDHLPPRAMRQWRRELQVVFQDPYSSLNPRLRAGDIVAEPLVNFGVMRGAALRDRVAGLFAQVGLSADAMRRYPHEFSGGQRQRIGIARALALDPSLVVCDEPVSALDVSIQSQVLNLLVDLQREFNLTYLFITHNLAVVKHVSDRIAVMYLGRIVEMTDADGLYACPRHPYTRMLIAAIPEPDPQSRRGHFPGIGDLPSPINPPSGCHFHPRCPFATELCKKETPVLRETSSAGAASHSVACHYDLTPAAIPSPHGPPTAA